MQFESERKRRKHKFRIAKRFSRAVRKVVNFRDHSVWKTFPIGIKSGGYVETVYGSFTPGGRNVAASFYHTTRPKTKGK